MSDNKTPHQSVVEALEALCVELAGRYYVYEGRGPDKPMQRIDVTQHVHKILNAFDPPEDPRDEAIRELAKCLNNCRRYQVCDELDKIMDPVLTKYAATIKAAGLTGERK